MNVSLNLSKNARQIRSEINEVKRPSKISKLLELTVSKLLYKCKSGTITIEDLPELEDKKQSQKVMSGYKWKRRVMFSILLKFWKSFACAFTFRVLAIFSDYASMLLLKYLIDSAEIKASLFNFFVISVLILFFMQLKSILLGVHTYLVGEDSALMITVLNNIIVKKALHVTTEKKEWNRTKVKKLLTTHSEAVSNALIYVHHSCSALIELVIVIFWIWETLGTHTIIVVLIIPFVYITFNIIDSYIYKKSMRVEFEKTVLKSMETIKLFSWESHFMNKLNHLRAKELSIFGKTSSINTFMHSLNVTFPFVITFVSFAVYGLQYNISELRFEDAFVLIAVFNYTRRPLHLIIPSLEVFNKAFHSTTRINQFLIAKESPKSDTKSLPQAPTDTQVDFVVSKRISFAPANPYIFSQTLKENILFGNDYIKTKYDKVVTACDLKKDIFALPRCDATMLGDKGFPLSPTQQAQISLARCLYDDADIYALDKAFALMDSSTLNKVFQRVMSEDGYLSGKTAILATNNVELTKSFSTIHILNEGTIEMSGSYEHLLGSSKIMKRLFEQSQIEKILEEKYSDEKPIRKTVAFNVEKLRKSKKKSMESDRRSPIVENRSIYYFYLRSGSFVFSALYVVLLICRFVFQSLAFFWLSFWLDPLWRKEECENCPQFVFIQTLSFFGVSAIFSTMLSYAFFVLTNVQASKTLYHHISNSVFTVPISFLTQKNTEGLVQLFTSDIDIADSQFPMFFKFSFESSLHIVMIFAIVCVNVPFFVIFVLAFLIFIVGLLKFYFPAFHKIFQLEEQKREQFLCGSTEYFEARLLVRIFGKSRQALAKSSGQADILTQCRVAKSSTLRWLSLRTEFVANLLVFSSFIIAAICLKVNYIGDAQFALSVASILCITELVSTFIRTTCILESIAPHIQNISNVMDFPKEQLIDQCTIRDSWPDNGKIDINNLNVFVNKEKHVIKDLSLHVDEREKFGIIGKPGSGKTQLALTLVAMSSADEESRVLVDDQDIFEMSVKTLRSRITVVPQEAKIFEDTLRNNIDPCCQFADSDVWLVIEACQLKEFVNTLPDGIQQYVSAESMNEEQKSQINACRALLKGGQIFVIDQSMKLMKEPKRSLVEETFRQSLKQSTTILIGEELQDVQHCDKVVVIENGVVLITDTPQNLRANFGSLQQCLLNFSR
ncbi:unnamed protein product [Caenorhabditis sp. 36 PRJEB53466]|nr:unnamed protein product [Caenorhabditis sp. 36 PRJEB53466]